MRFMILVKATRDSEAGVMPDEKRIDEMAAYHEELKKAGALLDGSGLQPSAKGWRIRYSQGKRTVIDGPFAETKELIAGYTLIQVGSREDAIEWTMRFPNPAVGVTAAAFIRGPDAGDPDAPGSGGENPARRVGMKARTGFFLFVLLFFLPAIASPQGLDPVNKNALGLAVRGYDAVAYHAENKAVPGKEEFQHVWKGARWYFASAGNRDAFARNPEKYAPKFGGYCAYAVSHGYTADGDPRVWKIVDGSLYLNYNRDAQRLWEEDVPGNIAKGNENWPEFLKRKPEHKG